MKLRRAFRYLLPHRAALLGVLVLALATAGFQAAEPLLLKHLVDRIEAGAAQVLALVFLFGAGFVRELAASFSNWLTWRTRIAIHFALTEATVDHIHRLPLSFHRSEGVGALLTRLDRSVQGFATAVSELGVQLVPAVIYLIISIGVMLRLDWRMALAALVFVPVPALIATFAAPIQTRRERQLLERWVRIYARFNEVLTGMVTVKSLAMEEAEKRRFLSDVSEANQVVTRGVGTDSLITAAQNLSALLARIATLSVGGYLCARGELSIGELLAFIGYVSGMFGPVQGLSGMYKTLRVASVSLDQVFTLLDTEDRMRDAEDAREVGPLRGEIRFDGVHFRYPDTAQLHPLIAGIDLTIAAGEKVALVGPSGAGKSTLVALLCRFYDPDRGAVHVDGFDVRSLKQRSLRRQIGIVMQDALLFNESVRNNITYGRQEATLEQIQAAAKAAHAHEFIARLPHGYDTVVGERGNRLSAGERQRLAIARALLKDSPILILDEPTSALDAESEFLVQQALERLTRNRTTLAIAHRLSTVVGADRILVLKEGRIVEQGCHGQLIRQGGYYASLVERQTRGLLPNVA